MRSYRKILIFVLLLIIVHLLRAQNPMSMKGVDAPHGDPTKLPNLCADCHFGYNSPNSTQTINDKCLSCHNGISAPAAETHRNQSCTVCHNPHHQEQERVNASTYSKLIRTTINSHSVKLMASSGANSFADGDSVFNGVCEVCHTTTKYHRNNGTGVSHNNGANCTACHPHDLGFSVGAGGPDCLQCHDNPMGSRRAVGPDFSSSKPHHPLTYNRSGNLNSPVDNNCLICHKDYPNLHGNGVVDLNPDPDNSGTQEGLGVYSDPWCMDCHDGNNPDPNYRLGGKVAPDKRSFYSTQNAHRNGIAFSGRCSDCHTTRNGHTASIQFYSVFYMDDKEENMCYGCHGGAANVSSTHGYMENIRVAFTTGNINSKSKHASIDNLNTSDGKVFCRNCHDLHQLNHTTNLLIDPQNKTVPWTGTRSAFCLQCHTGGSTQVHSNHLNANCGGCHPTSGTNPECSDCHLPHSSTLESLVKLDIAGKALSVTPASASITLSTIQQFDAITTPAFTQFSPAVLDKLAQWSFVTTSGGSLGAQFIKNETPYIPLDRSLGYDPNGNGGWGLITVTSRITIADNTTIKDLNVYFNASHHYRGDLDLTVKHLETGTTVHVQMYDWNDWYSNLIFWYDSESPNDPHGNLSPRGTAQSLSAFNGESVNGTWELTILDTWPSDNPTNPADPTFCKVNSWGLAINGGFIGTFTNTGVFQPTYAGTGTVYATLRNGKLLPSQYGLDVSVYENPLPIQATASLAVNTLFVKNLIEPTQPKEFSVTERPRHPLKLLKQQAKSATTKTSHNYGGPCTSCHGR
jgi:hypothetical protein